MSKIVGIDLGTTNSLVATVDAGIPFVIADAEGQRLTPSVVHVPAAGAEPIVGHKANRVRVLKPAETVYSVKRFMGRRGADISREEMLVTYPVKGEGAGPVTIDLHGRSWTPEEISAEVLKKLKRDAENCFGEAVTRAVITVPAYFNDAQRNATKKAGELAGFTVERIVNEPTAAALAYGLDKLKEKSKIAVYDLGGGTFDLSILELNNGVFQVLSTNGNTRLGGDDLDKRVIDFLVVKIKAAGGPDLERAASVLLAQTPENSRNASGTLAARLAMLSRIREAAEQAKIRLSSETEVEVQLPFLTPDFSFSYKLTRKELEDLTRDIILRTRAHCLRSLSDAKLEAKDLDQVILVGGQTRMPLVRQLVSEWFGCAEFEESRGDVRLGTDFHKAKGPQLNTSQNPDEAVALGRGHPGGDSFRRLQKSFVARCDAAVARHRNVRRIDERDHSAQHDDSGEGGRNVHDGGGQSALDAHSRGPGRARAGERQLEPRPISKLNSSLRPKAFRAWACSSRSMPMEFCMRSRAT